MRIVGLVEEWRGWVKTARLNKIGWLEFCRRAMDQARFHFSLWLLRQLRSPAREERTCHAADCGPHANVVVCNLDNLGDALRVTPAIRAIKRHWPAARLTVLASSYNAAVFQSNPHIDDLVVVKRYPGPIRTWRLLSRIKRMNISHSLILCFGSGEAAYCAGVMQSAGVPVRIGWNNVEASLLTHCHVAGRESTHVELMNAVLRLIEIQPEGFQKEVFVTDVERGAACALLCGSPHNDLDPVIVIAPGGFGNVGYTVSRVWPEQQFRGLIEKILLFSDKARIIITGNQRETALADSICHGFDDTRVRNLVAKMGVRDLAALLKAADLVITNDNGTLHLADAVGTKNIICILGPTDPMLMAESGNDKIHIIRKKLDCGPCITRSAFLECIRPEGQKCLTDLSTEEVFTVVKSLLEAGEKR